MKDKVKKIALTIVIVFVWMIVNALAISFSDRMIEGSTLANESLAMYTAIIQVAPLALMVWAIFRVWKSK